MSVISEISSVGDAASSRKGMLAAACLMIAATAVGFASYAGGGEYSGLAILLITVGIVATLFGVLWSKRPGPTGDASLGLNALLGVAIAAEFVAIILWWPINQDSYESPWKGHHTIVFYCLTSASMLLTALSPLRLRWVQRLWFPLVLIAHLQLGYCVVRSAPTPHLDVWYMEQGGARTLLDGRNPYDFRQTRFVDINDRPNGGSQVVYGKELEENGRLKFGFPYPPVSLMCSTAAYWLTGESRFAQMFALTLAGLFIGYCRPGYRPKLAAVLLLFTPITWYLLACGWTEPIVVMLLAAVIFCAGRSLRRVLPIAFGLFLASKQYTPLLLPLSFLLIPEFDWRSSASWKRWITLVVVALLVATVISLPLAMWDWHAFLVSTYELQKSAPFRWNAISYLVWIHRQLIFGRHLNPTKWVWLAFVFVVPAVLFAMLKARRSPAGFCASAAFVFLIFLSLNKQAFCNYYFFVNGCLCMAVAFTATGILPEPGAIT